MSDKRIELPYLDGIRGAAALTIVLYHAFLFTGHTGDAYNDLPILGWFLGYGYLGVPIFIVLSGYVLMLPIAMQREFKLRTSFKRYIGRRARRILPPYYAALAISLILIATFPIMQEPSGTQWDTKVPVTIGGTISHLLLIHDMSGSWIGQINGPLWSIAVEWQIYFLMPLVILPLWRRVNPIIVASGLLVASLSVALLFGRFPYAHPWLIGLFSLGMLAAYSTLNANWELLWLLRATKMLTLCTVVVLFGAWNWMHSHPWASESLVGILFAASLVILGRASLAGIESRVINFFKSALMIRLGLVSYSVYLLHSPLIGLANLLTLHWNLPTWLQYLFLTLVVVPTVLAVCVGFYWLVERRFQNTHQRSVSSTQVVQSSTS
ncbi:acyltransferase family protein [Kocuria sp. CPCC 205263]|uniref:acyltransferase family protein n=1 Tax=Kocuria sp. CPCC 205263 TaxID=3073555 RepID=UPI0034D69640